MIETVHREGEGRRRISSLDEQSVEARLSRDGNQSVLEAAVEAVAAARVNHRRINTEMGRVHAIPRPASRRHLSSAYQRIPAGLCEHATWIYIRRQYRPDGPKIIPPPRRG